VNQTRIERMRHCLQAEFSPSELEIADESHRHVGHPGARDGRGHFRVRIVAEGFANLPMLARHRRVYAALGNMMQTDIHALSLDTRTPEEVNEN